MRTQLLAWLLALLCLAPSLALAKGSNRVMVLDIPPDDAFKPNVIKAVNDFLGAAIRDQGFDVVTAADIAAVLGVERQKQLLGCSESNCLAEIGGALGAAYLVHGTLAVLENDTALSISVVDSKGKAINQARKLIKGKSADVLIPAVEELVPKLMAPIKPAAVAGPPKAAEPAAGGLVASRAPPAASGGKTLPYTLLGAGVVALAGSAVFGYLAKSSQTQMYDDATQGRAGDASAAASDVKRNAWISTGLLAGGLVTAGAGAALFFLSGSEPAPAPAAAP